MVHNLNASGRTAYIRNLSRHKVLYALGVMTLFVTSTAEVLVPKFVQWILDLLIHGQTPKWLGLSLKDRPQILDLLVLYLLGVVLLGWCGRVGWRQILARRTHVSGHELKSQFWQALSRQKLSVFQRLTLGDLMNRATADWNAARIIHGFTVVLSFDLIFFTILAVIAMLSINVPLTLVSLIGFPLLSPFVVKFARREYDQHLVAQGKLSSLSHLISQTIQSARLQRATGSESIWQKKLSDAARIYANARFEVLKTGWRIFPFGTFPTVITYAVILGLGIHEINAGRLSVGAFVALQSYVLLLQVPLFELAELCSEWQTGMAGMQRITEIHEMNEKEVSKPGQTMPQSPESIVGLKGVSFSYSESLAPVFKNLDLTLHLGEIVGITGPVGSGKTTLLTLLSGLLVPTTGQYLLLGSDASTLGREAFSNSVSLVPQKSFVFAGSFRHNLCLDREFPDELLWRALKLVRLEQDVMKKSDRLDAWIGEGGVNLSGGQRQRLALARAILRPTPLLLLDDCLSAVDAVTERAILGDLSQAWAGRTVVWAAHRSSSLRLCTRLIAIGTEKER